MYRRLRVVILSLCVFSVAAWAADDPLLGAWKLNVGKSKFSAGFPVPQTQIYKYEASGADGVKYTSDTTDAKGKSTHIEYTAKYDGKDYPVTGDPTRDTVSLKHVDASTTEGTSKKAGKVASTFRRVISKDGKVLTITAKGTRDGKPFNNVTVLDKQ